VLLSLKAMFSFVDMEYGDVPCAGAVNVIGKIHGALCGYDLIVYKSSARRISRTTGYQQV